MWRYLKLSSKELDQMKTNTVRTCMGSYFVNISKTCGFGVNENVLRLITISKEDNIQIMNVYECNGKNIFMRWKMECSIPSVDPSIL